MKEAFLTNIAFGYFSRIKVIRTFCNTANKLSCKCDVKSGGKFRNSYNGHAELWSMALTLFYACTIALGGMCTYTARHRLNFKPISGPVSSFRIPIRKALKEAFQRYTDAQGPSKHDTEAFVSHHYILIQHVVFHCITHAVSSSSSENQPWWQQRKLLGRTPKRESKL